MKTHAPIPPKAKWEGSIQARGHVFQRSENGVRRALLSLRRMGKFVDRARADYLFTSFCNTLKLRTHGWPDSKPLGNSWAARLAASREG